MSLRPASVCHVAAVAICGFVGMLIRHSVEDFMERCHAHLSAPFHVSTLAELAHPQHVWLVDPEQPQFRAGLTTLDSLPNLKHTYQARALHSSVQEVWEGMTLCAGRPVDQLLTHCTRAMGTNNTKHSLPPDVCDAWFESADVLLVLDDGIAIPCDSKVLSMHSAVIRNMLEDLASQHDEMVEIPLPDFSEAQCLALLKYLSHHSAPNKGAAFETHDTASHDATVAVARFAHVYDAPHALQQIQSYLSSFMEAHFNGTRDRGVMTMETYDEVVLKWAAMADMYDMHELCGRCEQAMTMHWNFYQDKPGLVDQLGGRALQRIAKGLNHAQRPGAYGTYAPGGLIIDLYPSVNDFIAWRQSGSIWSKRADGALEHPDVTR